MMAPRRLKLALEYVYPAPGLGQHPAHVFGERDRVVVVDALRVAEARGMGQQLVEGDLRFIGRDVFEV